MAVAVDRINRRGAIRVYDQEGTYVGGVGPETPGDAIVIPWELNRWFYATGNLRVGLVFSKEF